MQPGYPEIFSTFSLGHLLLRNRIVAPPMLQLRPITSQLGMAWYRRLARGGAGLVIVEVTSILRFGDELTARTLAPLVQTIHESGAAAAIQLFPVQFGQTTDPNTVTSSQIQSICQGYARAAAICRQAGFDAVEIHGAHGYLINQFFMPDVNRRTDQYGGSLAARCQLAVDIIRHVRQAVGDDFLIFYRHTPLGAAYGVEDSLELAARLIEAGVNLLDISPARQSIEADLAAPFKAHFKVPVIAVKGMECPAKATAALRAGRCDLVAIGRGLIADAQWPLKVRAGRWIDVLQCLQCDSGCFGHLSLQRPVYCAVWNRDEIAAAAK